MRTRIGRLGTGNNKETRLYCKIYKILYKEEGKGKW
jgi:hypothetical protein